MLRTGCICLTHVVMYTECIIQFNFRQVLNVKVLRQRSFDAGIAQYRIEWKVRFF